MNSGWARRGGRWLAVAGAVGRSDWPPRVTHRMAAWDPLALNAFVFYDTEFTSWEGAMQRNWSNPDEYRELVCARRALRLLSLCCHPSVCCLPLLLLGTQCSHWLCPAVHWSGSCACTGPAFCDPCAALGDQQHAHPAAAHRAHAQPGGPRQPGRLCHGGHTAAAPGRGAADCRPPQADGEAASQSSSLPVPDRSHRDYPAGSRRGGRRSGGGTALHHKKSLSTSYVPKQP
eukprot:COSAG06_NODE_3999_length_4675_cov_2.774194_1_plen_231_part_00